MTADLSMSVDVSLERGMYAHLDVNRLHPRTLVSNTVPQETVDAHPLSLLDQTVPPLLPGVVARPRAVAALSLITS